MSVVLIFAVAQSVSLSSYCVCIGSLESCRDFTVRISFAQTLDIESKEGLSHLLGDKEVDHIKRLFDLRDFRLEGFLSLEVIGFHVFVFSVMIHVVEVAIPGHVDLRQRNTYAIIS